MPKIENFQQAVQQAQQERLDNVLHLGDEGSVTLHRPLKLPGRWTRFRAWLGGMPVLKNLASLREARAKVDSYPQRLHEFQISNRQVMQSFIHALQEEFGPGIANMTVKDLDTTGGTPLTARMVTVLTGKAEQMRNTYKMTNNYNIMRFLENGLTGGARGIGENDMIGLFLERGIKLGEAGQWQDAISRELATALEKLFKLECEALPEYTRGILSNDKLTEIGNSVLDFMAELENAGLSEEVLKKIPDKMAKASTPAELMGKIRHLVINDGAKELLDRKNPDSLFSKAVGDTVKELNITHKIPDAVIKSIAHDLSDRLNYTLDLPAFFHARITLQT